MQIIMATSYCLMPDLRIDGCGFISPSDSADRERVARTVPADRQVSFTCRHCEYHQSAPPVLPGRARQIGCGV
jgi:hypothetical protein